ncbi:MAG TPA: AmmeMemoRadiSam system protein B [Candidatus Hydrogenedens sp.]|nr:AmmeMemoRadiSam system protein B [Candidatus Hydrogenedens sp.]
MFLLQIRNRRTQQICLFFIIIFILFTYDSFPAEKIRRPYAAGTLYPGDPPVLKETIKKFFEQVPPVPNTNDKLTACVVPHSGWGLCGDLIARAFAELKEGEFNDVIILAPSHLIKIQGCSLPSIQGFSTPLGVVRVDYEKLEQMAICPYIVMQALQKSALPGKFALHEKEYSIEVVLPMLQYKMKKLNLLPVIVGEFIDNYGKERNFVFRDIVETLRRTINDKTLLILSTDLTSCGASFNFTPAPPEQMLEKQEQLDRELIDLIIKKDLLGLQDYFDRTKNPVCGKNAIYLFVALLPKNAQGTLLGYEQSGKKMNLKDTSIGFAAINFYIPSSTSQPQ